MAPRMTTGRWTAVAAVAMAAAAFAYLLLDRHAQPTRAPSPARAPDAAHEVAPSSPTGGFARAPAASSPQPLTNEADDRDATATSHRAAPPRERMSRKDLRGFVERMLKGKLADRELTSDDYDRLIDDMMEIRSATRAIRRAEESANGAAATADAREKIVAALADIETVTGVPPSELGTLLAPDDDSAAADAAPEAAPDTP
jgi:hypothetical protein